jgi:hypothetical protein
MSDLCPPRALLAAVVVLSLTAPAPAEEKQPLTAVVLREKLATTVKFPGLDKADITLGEALEFLTDLYDVPIGVDEKLLRARPEVLRTPIIGNRPMGRMTTTLGQAVQAVLSRTDDEFELTYVIRRDRVEITTRDAVDAEFYPDRGPDDFRPPLVTASVKKLPLEDALAELARGHDVNIVLDVQAGEAARVPVSAELTNVPADTAVRLLADMARLKSVRIDNVLYVTTPANAAALQKEQERKPPSPVGGPGVPPMGK